MDEVRKTRLLGIDFDIAARRVFDHAPKKKSSDDPKENELEDPAEVTAATMVHMDNTVFGPTDMSQFYYHGYSQGHI